MARRRKRPLNRGSIAWSPRFDGVFLAPKEWTPPARLQVWRTRTHITVAGRFVDEKGAGVHCTARLEPDGQGGLTVTDSTIKMSWTSRGRG